MTPASKEKALVVLGVLAKNNRILLTWRDASLHSGDCWELPGGRVETGELPRAALRREWHEELGLSVNVGAPIIAFAYDYPDRCLRFEVYEVHCRHAWCQLAVKRTTQWCQRDGLHNLPFPPANRAIVHAIQLPSTYAIIAADACTGGDDFAACLHHACRLGARLFLLRAPGLAGSGQHKLLHACCSMPVDCRRLLLVHDHPEWVEDYDLAGVHLSQAFAASLSKRPVADNRWFAVSCHNADEISRAEQLGADFCVLGPVAATPSHAEGSPVLGMDVFCSTVEKANIPVFAIGGMSMAALPDLRHCGAQGIAAIRCFAASSPNAGPFDG